jgi:hypothetical protein
MIRGVALFLTALLLAETPDLTVGPPSPGVGPASRSGASVTVTVHNPLAIARPAETITLNAAELRSALPVEDVRTVRVRDEATGADLLTQAIDANDDGTWDELIFQADIAAGGTSRFALTVGERRIPKKEEFRAYGRFVRERRDDFAWENDLVAHRMYGTALETWKQEPLTSSAVDVWVKRTRRLVINEWYMVDDYHRDTGDGADFYSAGRTRGCGGSGIWHGGTLFTSANFRHSRVLANGPIRVMFELTYDAWDAGGARVAETKRITLDAGHHLNRFESTYTNAPASAAVGIGIRNNPGSQSATPAAGVLRTWEPIKNNAAENGSMGCAVVVPGAGSLTPQPVDGNYLVTAALSGGRVVYYAGSSWDRGGVLKNVQDWDARLTQAAARIGAPVGVRLSAAAVK